MLEKEVKAIAKFVVEAAGHPKEYYHNVPENFIVPSVFFPSPEVSLLPDTLNSYGAEYVMYVNFFHCSTEDAYALALPVFHKINAVRKLLPIFDDTGKRLKEEVRIKEMRLKKADECAYELMLEWVSRHPYEQNDAELVRRFFMNGGKL